VVTKEELMALAAKLDADGPGDQRGPGGKGPGGPGGKRPDGPGGPGGRGPDGPGGRGPGAQPGQVLPAFVVETLNLTAEQKKQLEALQKDVDARLAKILTAEQKKQLEEMGPGRGGPSGRGERGERGPGGPGRRGPDGPGGDRPPQ
jgi:Spy/CpxP family protein refolding chaperone